MTITTTTSPTPRRTRAGALLALAPALMATWTQSGCFGPVQVSGGPSRTTLSLNPASLGDDLRPLVRDEPEALARLERVERNGRISRVFLWSGFGALAGCLLFSNSAINQRTSDTTFGLIIGTCGLAIGLEVASLIFAPTYGDYGDVLRTYNARRPATAWFAPRLGVDPPVAAFRLPGAYSTALRLRSPRLGLRWTPESPQAYALVAPSAVQWF